MTDRRTVVLVPQSAGRPDRDRRFPIHFADVSRVGLDDPNDPTVLSVTHDHGHRWRIPVESIDSERVADAASYVKTGAEVWTRAQETASTVHASREDLLEPIRDHGDWQLVADRYDFLTERIADARRRAEDTLFADADAFGQTVGRAERTLETVYSRALLYRLTAEVTSAREHLAEDDVEAALAPFAVAVESYRAVAGRVESEGVDPLYTGVSTTDRSVADGDHDDPQTPLTAADTDDALSVAADRIRQVAGDALDAAAEARTRAGQAPDTDGTITHLEAALETYRSVLDTCWSAQTVLPVDRTALQSLVEDTVAELIEVRRAGAETAEWHAHGALAEDDQVRAARLLDRGIDSLEPVLELAREYRAGDRESIAALLERLRDDRSGLQAGAALKA